MHFAQPEKNAEFVAVAHADEAFNTALGPAGKREFLAANARLHKIGQADPHRTPIFFLSAVVPKRFWVGVGT
jgi:hypothetical protein